MQVGDTATLRLHMEVFLNFDSLGMRELYKTGWMTQVSCRLRRHLIQNKLSMLLTL